MSELVVAGTVNTMLAATLRAFADHGQDCGDRVTGTSAAAQQVFNDLQRVGIDLTEVFLTLENDGLVKFEASWDELGATVLSQLDQAR